MGRRRATTLCTCALFLFAGAARARAVPASCRPGWAWGRTPSQAEERSEVYRRSRLVQLMRCRGGQTTEPKDMKVIIQTPTVNTFIDQKCSLSLRPDSTVLQLKERLAKEFPGRPPVLVQRIFRGVELVRDESTLAEVFDGIDSNRRLILDMPPPTDPKKFDPDSAVPSKRDGQLEAFCANLAAQHRMLDGFLRHLDGGAPPFGAAGDGGAAASAALKGDYEAAKALLEATVKAAAVGAVSTDGGDAAAGQEQPEVRHGPLHEVLRPLAKQFDIEWDNTVRMAVFLIICGRFGAEGRFRELSTVMLVPAVFLYQTRWAKMAYKLLFNLVPLVPGLAELVVALLPAPQQALLLFDDEAYVRRLYGAGGPKLPAAAVAVRAAGEEGWEGGSAVEGEEPGGTRGRGEKGAAAAAGAGKEVDEGAEESAEEDGLGGLSEDDSSDFETSEEDLF